MTSRRKSIFVKKVFTCKDHNAVEWKTEIYGQCSKCLKYKSVDCFSNGHFPTGNEVLQHLLYLKASNSG